MRAFTADRWSGVGYFFVLDERSPVFPFGLCGPFSKRREAKRAATKLKSINPQFLLSVHGGTFWGSGCTFKSMSTARNEARNKLKSMRSTCERPITEEGKG